MSAGLRAGTNNDGYLQINGTDVLTALSSGRIGIGTTNPSNTLHVQGVARFNNNSSNNLIISTDSGNPFVFVEQSANFVFGTNSTERLRITSTGNVGIGVTNPTSKLEVVGAISSTGSTSPTGTGLVFGDNSSGGYKWIQSFNSQPLVINPLGNFVGIGTTSPGTILDIHRSVSANVGPEVRLTNFAGTANDKARVSFYGGLSGSTTLRGALDFNIHTSGTSELIWSSGEVTVTERFRINQTGDVRISNGNLIIGTGGKGIDFSAAGNAPGMSGELLDDYEFGTFTPSIAFGGSDLNVVYTDRTGRYTKIGNRVFFNIVLNFSNKGTATGIATITGLPFTPGAGVAGYGAATGADIAGITFDNVIHYRIVGNNTSMTIMQNGGSALTNTNFATAAQQIVSGHYYVD